MTGRIASIRIAPAACGTFVLVLLLAGCAPREMAGGARGPADGARMTRAGRRAPKAARDTAAARARVVRHRG